MKIIVNNLVVEYRDEGKGPVLLFLHGWKDSLRSFDPLIPLLVGSFRIVRVDLPGFGTSQLPGSAWDLNDYAEFVNAFINKLEIKVEGLVGHSFGGRVAIKGVATNTFSSNRLILMASAGVTKSLGMRKLLYKLIAKIGQALTIVPPFSFFRTQLRQKLYQHAGSDYLHAGPLKKIFINVTREDLSGYAKKITLPTLLIWGGKDMETPLADGKHLASLIPGAKLKIIESSGHFVHQENPTTVALLINKFLTT